jgi:hypothetical protein
MMEDEPSYYSVEYYMSGNYFGSHGGPYVYSQEHEIRPSDIENATPIHYSIDEICYLDHDIAIYEDLNN